MTVAMERIGAHSRVPEIHGRLSLRIQRIVIGNVAVCIGNFTDKKGFGRTLDPVDYVADVKLSIAPDVKLPKDSVVAIAGDGLVGNKFVKIEPGKSSEMLQNGDWVENTKDFKTLEDMVGEIIFMVTDNGEKK